MLFSKLSKSVILGFTSTCVTLHEMQHFYFIIENNLWVFTVQCFWATATVVKSF